MTAIPEGIAIHRRDLATQWCDTWWMPLSPGERDRADRYRRDDDRRRSVAGRHLIRTTLAPLLACAASAVPIAIDRHGRPVVDGAPAFSLSHAGDQVALAVAPVGVALTVGIDIEVVRDDIDPLALGRRVFAGAELTALQSAGDRIALFFRLWTIKEALLKAAGRGLSIDPRTVRIDAESDPPAIVDAPAALGLRGCVVLPCPPGYAAALAWGT